MSYSPHPIPLQMSATLLESQPLLDLTPASNIELIFSDLGVMMPSGISDALLAIYGGE